MVWALIILGVICLVVMLWAISSLESSCTGNCRQGRECDCMKGGNDE